jgi:hypothetical protein
MSYELKTKSLFRNMVIQNMNKSVLICTYLEIFEKAF